MTDTQRTWFIRISIIVGVLLALLLLVSVIRNRGNTSPVEQSKDTNSSGTVQPPSVASTTTLSSVRTSTPAMSPNDRYLVQLSRMIVERLGSYSNQNENDHIDDVLPLLTERMIRYVNTLRMGQSATYSGQTTRVITAELQSKNGGKAVVLVGVQIESSTPTESVRSYKNARVEISEVKKNDWRVDGIFWE